VGTRHCEQVQLLEDERLPAKHAIGSKPGISTSYRYRGSHPVTLRFDHPAENRVQNATLIEDVAAEGVCFDVV
jgi:hypothetical protein